MVGLKSQVPDPFETKREILVYAQPPHRKLARSVVEASLSRRRSVARSVRLPSNHRPFRNKPFRSIDLPEDEDEAPTKKKLKKKK